MKIALAAMLVCAGLAQASEEYSYWVEPCDAEAARTTACEPGDVELARWALEAWQRESGGAIVFKPAAGEAHARIKLHWANGAANLYGETQPTVVDGKRGATMYVLPDVRGLGPDILAASRADRLFRDVVVYLTCLHESGHALGLAHTRAFADIMYSFMYGGDFVGYFQRYRAELQTRADIPRHSGISAADRTTFRALGKP